MRTRRPGAVGWWTLVALGGCTGAATVAPDAGRALDAARASDVARASDSAPGSDVLADEPVVADDVTGPATDVPVVAGDAGLTARTDPTPVVADGTTAALIINADDVRLPGRDWGYAYGATIIKSTSPSGGARYNLFACTTGVAGGTADQVRYTYSDDGLHWSAPVVKVSATGDVGSLDFSACDPSVVFYGGYYYLYYSGERSIPQAGCGASNSNAETVVRVARSTTIDGDYEKALTDAAGHVTWVSAAAQSPANNPSVVVGPRHLVCGAYGAGQQTVVVRDGRIWMWYVDDTAAADGSALPGRAGFTVFLTSSTDPLSFDFYHSTPTNADFIALDIKYDDRSRAFVEIAVPWVATSGPNGGIAAIPSRYSYDGIHWSGGRDVVGVNGMPRWSRVEGGFSGDASGHFASGNTLVAFGCPHGYCTELGHAGPATNPPNGYWDMWGYYVADLSGSLFAP